MEFSNRYIFGFSLALCLICSLGVSFTHVSLREMQLENAEKDQKSQVLQAAGIMQEGTELTGDEIAAYFEEIDELVIDRKTGEVLEGADFAFQPRSVAKTSEGGTDAPEVHAKATGVTRLPNHLRAFRVRVPDSECLVLEVYGNGLWSTLLGYLALSPNTLEVKGLTYYSHKETPGLGGEVDNPKWKAQWKGKEALSAEGEILVKVVKGLSADPQREVDGLSGATITSRGVDSMLKLWLGEAGYGPFLQIQRGAL